MVDTKAIGSTQAQNNFGQVLDDVARNHTRYIVSRNGVPQAIVLGLEDLSGVLGNETERRQFDEVLKEIRPRYHLGEIIRSSINRDDASEAVENRKEPVQYSGRARVTTEGRQRSKNRSASDTGHRRRVASQDDSAIRIRER